MTTQFPQPRILYSPILRTYGPRLIPDHPLGPRLIEVSGRKYYSLICVLPKDQPAYVAGFTPRTPSGMLQPICATGMPTKDTCLWDIRWPADDGPADPPTPQPPKPNSYITQKDIDFFNNYGTGPSKIQGIIAMKITGQKAKDLIDSFYENFPGIGPFHDPNEFGELFDPP